MPIELMSKLTELIGKIEEAEERLYEDPDENEGKDVSSLTDASRLSERLGNTVLFKREDRSSVFSFKWRGALNKIALLSKDAREAGIVAASAGNHAQGVASACEQIGVDATIVMPETTPEIKVNAVCGYSGVNITQYGDTYDQAYGYARKLCDEQKKTFIHPYDDLDVIAGQGTVGKEILDQFEVIKESSPPDVVFVPVGGGGLLAGVATWIKHHSPTTKVIAVEPEDAACLHAAMAAGKPVDLDEVGLFADGVAVKRIGYLPFDFVRDLVDEVVLVTTDEICAAIKDVFEDTRTLVEPAGALSVAGLKKYVREKEVSDQTLVPIISGANVNFNRLMHIVERYEIGANNEALFAVTIPEKPGSFKKFCRLLGDHAITEFNYRYADDNDAHVFVGLRFAEADKEKAAVVELLQSEGYKTHDLSDDEMSKLHLRHMIGGRAPQAANEHIYRFIFPERPGAFLGFLESLKQDWNISLFHYRNHGAAHGRVLAGIQVPDEELDELHAFFDETGYRWVDESANPAYELFLR